jgi:ABC-2 type transport system permease protein
MEAPATTRNTQYAVRALKEPGSAFRRAGKYLAIMRMSMSNQFAYIGESLVRSIFLVLIIYVFVQLWTLTYGVLGRERIGEYSLAQMIWYFAFAEAILMSVPLLRRKVDEEVKSGELAYRLAKPYSYIFYLAADYFGEWLARFVLNLAIGSALAFILIGPIPFSLWGIASAFVVLAGAVVLDFLGAASIGLLAFWIEDTAPLSLIYRRLVMLLGGMMIPLDVFPEPLSSIAQSLPFAYMVYGPARQWVSPSEAFFWELLPKLAISLAVGVGIVFLLFRAGQRNVTVNGG